MITLRPEMLRIVELGPSRQRRESQQKLSQRVPRKTEEREETSGLNISERVLLEFSNVRSKFEQMAAARIGRVINPLKNVRGALLWVVVLIPKGGKSGHCNVAQTKIPWIAGKVRQPYLLINT